MRQRRIYISGQITGLPYEEFKARFAEAERKLQAEGYIVVNPLKIEVDPEEVDANKHTEEEVWQAFLRADIIELMKCEVVYMLPNWEHSEGATLEHRIAQGLHIPILYEVEPRNREVKDAIEIAMGVPFRLISRDSRNRWHVYARMIYAHHCKKAGDNTQQIATETKHDESSICYYLRHYESEYKFNREFRNAAEKVATLLSRKLSRTKNK